MSLEIALKTMLDQVPDCVFSGYLDLEVGMMLSTQGSDAYDDEVIDNLAAAVVNLFESSHSIGIENAFRQATGREHDLEPYFREIVIVTPGLVHAFVRALGSDNRIVCVTSKASAGATRILQFTRAAADMIEAEVNA
jgi:hypothetical protein